MEKLERTCAVEKLCDHVLRGCPPSVGEDAEVVCPDCK